MRKGTANYLRWLSSGFFDRYLSGANILDIGFAGEDADSSPIVDQAIGVDVNYPGYDGIHLPFPDKSQDAVFSSHCFEHIEDYRTALQEWYRVLRAGGYLVILVPHKYLYERKSTLPSYFNPQHKRFYTPAKLLGEFEEVLPVNGFRIRHLADNDLEFDYSVGIAEHPRGSCEIELVIQKIEAPPDSELLELAPERRAYVDSCNRLIIDALRRAAAGRLSPQDVRVMVQGMAYFPCYEIVRSTLDGSMAAPSGENFRSILKEVLAAVAFDEALYLSIYSDIRDAVQNGVIGSAREHFIQAGYFEGRVFQKDPASMPLPDQVVRGP